MTKSELIDLLAEEQDHLAYKDVEEAVRKIIDRMSAALATGERIEIRGFGSFSLHYRPPRIGRNPKTGDAVALAGKHVPHFKPGKELRDRVNSAYESIQEERLEPAGAGRGCARLAASLIPGLPGSLATPPVGVRVRGATPHPSGCRRPAHPLFRLLEPHPCGSSLTPGPPGRRSRMTLARH